MEEGERKDEASPALVFFGNRSHTFSLRCKPKVHAELQTQKCSPEKFLIDNYNSGTGTYLLQLLGFTMMKNYLKSLILAKEFQIRDGIF